MELLLAPLQTYTDHHYRNAFHQVYTGIDQYYAPYLRLNNDGSIKEGPKVDILPKNNPYFNITPQLMCCGIDEFFILHDYIVSLGYEEVNWNMGCPYPMVTNRNLGAGILNKPDELHRLLEAIYPRLKLKLGIKMRMGMEETSEILDLLPILNQFPLTEIIIHARNAKQLYTGGCDVEMFKQCINETDHRLSYNGDINNLEGFEELRDQLPTINRWMIGRAAVSNPALFEEIKTGQLIDTSTYRERLLAFSKAIESSCLVSNPDQGFALSRMKSYWEGFCEELSEGKQLFRKIKKAKSLNELNDFTESIVD
ncbi:MAG: tRNA-dihydrouridine synthase family protein [Fluviicola sp.]|nr:tRNA-dihydrouridine synthase family protein [Fluviicola sp.]